MQDFEKLGQFYLGREYDVGRREVGPRDLLYDSKDLTTHAVCVGMTGSGKTGLGIALLEEAAIDGVPAIAIDPKGDLGNLLLTFPELRPEDFLPWVDPDEAGRKGLTREEFAAMTAQTWRDGLAAWGEDGARIARYRDAVDAAIYTPGSSAGLPLTVLRSFAAPPPGLADQPDAYRQRLASAVSGLLALLGIDADPMASREHILLSNVLDHSWRAGHDLDMAGLIHAVQSPPFQKVGVLDLETFFPARDRFSLAMKLNNLLASPGFASWLEGEPMDVGGLLSTPAGKPRLSIISIAHLSDAERMFFVTILLNEVLAWARSQPGTSSLRAVLYMDEIFGYFPATSNPPSKLPMLTLLKQARAYGLGVVLATQNPVDLDYKGLSNAGTWFIGRLQTQRDKDRVLDGLEGASTSAGHAFDRPQMDRLLSALGQRVFVMNNVHEERPVVFQTRWTLSYLRGPLTREQVQSIRGPLSAVRGPLTRLSGAAGEGPGGGEAIENMEGGSPTTDHGPRTTDERTTDRSPVVPPDVPVFFVPRRGRVEPGDSILYRPSILGVVRLHYADKKAGVDHWETLALLQPIGEAMPAEPWAESVPFDDGVPELDRAPEAGARFATLPPELARARCYADWTRSLKNYLYRERTLDLWRCPEVKAISRPSEAEREFRLRVAQASREDRDREVEKLRAKYAPRMSALEDQIRRAHERLEREQAEASGSTWDATIALGNTVLGSLFGRKAISKTNLGRAASAARAAGRAARQHGDIGRAEASLEVLESRYAKLEAEFQQEVRQIVAPLRPEAVALQPVPIRPRKADITVEQVVLAWTPWKVGAQGDPEPVYRG
jgi:hypothetical protein